MSKEKQIEEMARTLCGEKEKRCQDCDSYDLCEFWVEASTLHNNGYRKQCEGEWEVFGIANPKCSLCRSYNIEKSRFCPNCGAKMKGE